MPKTSTELAAAISAKLSAGEISGPAAEHLNKMARRHPELGITGAQTPAERIEELLAGPVEVEEAREMSGLLRRLQAAEQEAAEKAAEQQRQGGGRGQP